MSQISQLKCQTLDMHSESMPQRRCKDSKRLYFGVSLASLSVQPHISMCAYQRWLVTSNVYVLNKQYALNRHMCLTTRLYGILACDGGTTDFMYSNIVVTLTQ